MMNGWGENAAGSARIAESLAADDAVWGVYGTVVSDEELEKGGIAGVASMYAREMVEAQPHGPFHLLGYSVGCIIAFAVAGELRRQGREIGRLTLLDGFPTGVPPEVLVHPVNRFRAGRLLMRAVRLARVAYRGLRRRLLTVWRFLQGVPEPVRPPRKAAAQLVWETLLGIGGQERDAEVRKPRGRFAEAAMRYRPERSQIPVLLVVSLVEKRLEEKRRGWRWLSCGSFEEIRTRRSHRQLMELETLDEVAPVVFPCCVESGCSWWRRAGRRG